MRNRSSLIDSSAFVTCYPPTFTSGILPAKTHVRAPLPFNPFFRPSTVLKPLTRSTSPHQFRASTATPTTHVLTIIAPDSQTNTSLEQPVAQLISDTNAFVSHTRPLSDAVSEIHVHIPIPDNVDPLIRSLRNLTEKGRADIALQPVSLINERKRVAVFDLDSTLIQQETIDELAAELGLSEQVSEITERAMNGELDFREALKERVALLKGLSLDALDSVKGRVCFTPGAHELISVLRRTGVRTAVVSGGFHFLADHVRDVLGIDYSRANRLETAEDGLLTGRTEGDIVDAEFKRSTMKAMAEQLAVPREAVIAVGDGSNDLLMIAEAGLGVAFNAKPVVQKKAPYRINQPSLINVLYLLGYSDEQIHALA